MCRANASGEHLHHFSTDELDQVQLSTTRPYIPHVSRPDPNQAVFQLHPLSWTSDTVRDYHTKLLGHLVPYPDANTYEMDGDDHDEEPPKGTPAWAMRENENEMNHEEA